jgi:chorismate mutase/prephenate dehydratase
MSDSKELDRVREQIDTLDQQIQELINRRASCAEQVAEIKTAEVAAARERGESPQEVLFYRPEREAQVLNRIKERNAGPLPADSMAGIFREIMSACWARKALSPRRRPSSILATR